MIGVLPVLGLDGTSMTKVTLAALHGAGLGRLFGPMTRGDGVIFTLHNVSPEPARDFDPNGLLRVTPAFLDTAIATALSAGYDVVSLDEAARRLSATEPAPPFACFTFDDGYRDNRDYAYPVFKRRGLPFAIYVPTAYADGEGDLWWFVLEHAIARSTAPLRFTLKDGGTEILDVSSAAAKRNAFDRIYWDLRARPETELRAAVARLAEEAGYDAIALCRDMIMDWDEIRALASDPLVTIGAHTRRHYAVAGLSEVEARAEIEESMRRIEQELGRPCRHFSFPYGDPGSAGERDFVIARQAGCLTAVTTRKDVLHRGQSLTALPRISLNGHYQEARYVEILMSGVPFPIHRAAAAAVAQVRRLSGRQDRAARPRPSRPGAASI